jgi:putative ABC transport system ATP-binding protein
MEIMELFQQLGNTGITNIVVTHEPHVGACAGRMITMRDGKIVADVQQQPVLAAAA